MSSLPGDLKQQLPEWQKRIIHMVNDGARLRTPTGREAYQIEKRRVICCLYRVTEAINRE